ncbi:MAG: hypothetical protein GX783_03640 [Clostridiales bacterium]|nr:hypothetical protein [Clostridiales bacterium]
MEDAIVSFIEYHLLELSYEKCDHENEEAELSLKIEEQTNEDNASLRRIILDVIFEGPIKGKISLAGTFNINNNFEYADGSNALRIIGSSILLPYARSIISFISAVDGSSPFIIPTLNLNNLFKDDSNMEEP